MVTQGSANLVTGLPGDIGVQRCGGAAADGGAHEWRPAEELAAGAERLGGPFPEVEAVLVDEDTAVLEAEAGVDDVTHLAAGGGIGVERDPVRAALCVVGLNVAGGDLEVLAAPG